jgi:hypothetical protein
MEYWRGDPAIIVRCVLRLVQSVFLAYCLSLHGWLDDIILHVIADHKDDIRISNLLPKTVSFTGAPALDRFASGSR